jgi:hypothetical protein
MSRTDCSAAEDHERDTAYEDSVFIAELATVNTLIARYVLRYTDAEANRATPVPIADEYALATRVAAAADAIRARAQRRDQHKGQ